MIRLLLLLAVACASPKPAVTKVEIVKPIPQNENENFIVFECMLEPRPEPPDEVKIDYEDEDAYRRVMVHVRKWNEMVQYTKEMDLWADTHSRCLRAIVRVLQ